MTTMMRCHVDSHLRWVELEDEAGQRRRYPRYRRLEHGSDDVHVQKEVNNGEFALTPMARRATCFPETVVLKTIALKMQLFGESSNPIVPVGVFVYYEFTSSAP
jgi:hypothetical protein